MVVVKLSLRNALGVLWIQKDKNLVKEDQGDFVFTKC